MSMFKVGDVIRLGNSRAARRAITLGTYYTVTGVAEDSGYPEYVEFLFD